MPAIEHFSYLSSTSVLITLPPIAYRFSLIIDHPLLNITYYKPFILYTIIYYKLFNLHTIIYYQSPRWPIYTHHVYLTFQHFIGSPSLLHSVERSSFGRLLQGDRLL